MVDYQYTTADCKSDAIKTIKQLFDKRLPFHDNNYKSKIIIISENDSKKLLVNHLHYFLKERQYFIVPLDSEDDFTAELLEKPEDNSNRVYLLDSMPNCKVVNAFILELLF